MWKDSYLIGIDRLDEQHKDLMRAVGATLRAMQKAERASEYKQQCMNAIYFLKNYTRKHYKEEEAFMESIAYDGLDEHKSQHKVLVKTVYDFEEEAIKANYDVMMVRSNIESIMASFLSHLLREDQKIPKKDTSSFSTISKMTRSYMEQLTEDAFSKTNQLMGMFGSKAHSKAKIGTPDIEADICFGLELRCSINKSLGFVFSRKLAREVFKYEAGRELSTTDDVLKVVSYLAEVSCKIAGTVSDIITNDGDHCEIEAPAKISMDEFPVTARYLTLNTTMGDMALLVYDTVELKTSMWKDSYLVGIETIDSQHKELFSIVENLLNALRESSSKADFIGNIRESMAFLKGYVGKHFETEEKYLADINYPELLMHKQLHVALMQDAGYHEKLLIESNYAMPKIRNLLGFLTTWLVNHVAVEDKKFALSRVHNYDAEASMTTEERLTLRIKESLEMMANLEPSNIRIRQEEFTPPVVNYHFGVDISGGTTKTIGFSFTAPIMVGIFKAMTGQTAHEPNDIVMSAISEICNIMSKRMAAVLSKGVCNVETPSFNAVDAFRKSGISFVVNTTIGDMVVRVA